MGKACCGTPAVHKYEFNGKTQIIKNKDKNTIERFAAGGSARIQVKNKKMDLAKEIAGKYLCFILLIYFYLSRSSKANPGRKPEEHTKRYSNTSFKEGMG